MLVQCWANVVNHKQIGLNKTVSSAAVEPTLGKFDHDSDIPDRSVLKLNILTKSHAAATADAGFTPRRGVVYAIGLRFCLIHMWWCYFTFCDICRREKFEVETMPSFLPITFFISKKKLLLFNWTAISPLAELYQSDK